MIVKNQLRNNFPNSFDKTAPVFSALVANDEGTGVMEFQLNSLLEYMAEWVDTTNVYDQTDELLMKTVQFVSFLKKFTNENDESIINRLKAIFIREHDTRWGTVADIKNVFKQYAETAEVYIIENSLSFVADNMLVEGDFSDLEQTAWTLNNCELTSEASFSGSFGAEIVPNSSIIQVVPVHESKKCTYFLHFFLEGTVGVKIIDNHGNYWNATTGSWTATATSNKVSTTDWANKSIWIDIDQNINEITVQFENSADSGNVDYVRLFKKPMYGSFTVLLHYSGELTGKELTLAPGRDDPVTNVSKSTYPEYYDKYGYFDKSFLTGVGSGSSVTVFQELLDLVKPIGVMANFELIKRETN